MLLSGIINTFFRVLIIIFIRAPPAEQHAPLYYDHAPGDTYDAPRSFPESDALANVDVDDSNAVIVEPPGIESEEDVAETEQPDKKMKSSSSSSSHVITTNPKLEIHSEEEDEDDEDEDSDEDMETDDEMFVQEVRETSKGLTQLVNHIQAKYPLLQCNQHISDSGIDF